MIRSIGSKMHWNYFLALERDLELTSRYVEFHSRNFNTYSIEFAHLLFAAASEVDVLAKLLCQRLAPKAPRENIKDYRDVLWKHLPDVVTTFVLIPRYGLEFCPWENWHKKIPEWWTGYNKVKHQRDTGFNNATLQNALNAMGALQIFVFHHYRFKYNLELDPEGLQKTSEMLRPASVLLKLPHSHYYGKLFVEGD